jgi:hypothetical protein
VALGLWGTSLALIASATITGYASDEVSTTVISLASFGLASAAAAATATVRTYFVLMNRKVDQFFQLGRDYGEATVRQMR